MTSYACIAASAPRRCSRIALACAASSASAKSSAGLQAVPLADRLGGRAPIACHSWRRCQARSSASSTSSDRRRRGDEARSIVVDQLGDAADVGDDRQPAAQHRLDHRQRIALEPRGQNQRVMVAPHRFDVVGEAAELHLPSAGRSSSISSSICRGCRRRAPHSDDLQRPRAPLGLPQHVEQQVLRLRRETGAGRRTRASTACRRPGHAGRRVGAHVERIVDDLAVRQVEGQVRFERRRDSGPRRSSTAPRRRTRARCASPLPRLDPLVRARRLQQQAVGNAQQRGRFA